MFDFAAAWYALFGGLTKIRCKLFCGCCKNTTGCVCCTQAREDEEPKEKKNG